MELNEMEKKLLFQVEGDYQTKILNELYMTVRYSNNSEQREAAEGLMAKLRVLSNAECMDLVKDIQKNYRLPYPARTIGEKIAEARQQSGAEKLKGHDIMALERFDPEVKHMIVFDVLSYDSPVGDKGDKMRLFLTDAGYQKFLESQERGEVKLKNHAKVSDGHLHYDRRVLWSSFFVTLVAKKIVLINLCYRPCFIWGSITIITVWTNMIIINVCKFFYLLIECFLCCKLIQICAFILQGIEITLHRCIVVRISCFAHALCHIYRFAEFGKCFGRIL